jgi:RHS repeat-associated protein
VNVPDENPSALGVFDLPLRLLGQYYDKETNLHYNYYRDYDPSIGIYRQSDVIGLRGGLNTYAYVLGNPILYVDPFGLEVTRWSRPADIGPYGVVGKAVDHHWLKTNQYESGMGPADGQVPAQEGRSDYFGSPVVTVDHTGQSKASNARQIPIPFPVDEECVNSFIRPGQSLGQFTPSNQCQAFSEETLNRCRIDPALNRPRGWVSGPIRRR